MTGIRQALKKARPLAGAHWSLPVALILIGLILLFSQPCKRGPYYVEYVAVAMSVCLVLWSHHIVKAPVQSVRSAAAIAGRSLYDLIALMGLLLLASFPVALFVPTYHCFTDRTRASEVLLAGSTLRTEIEANAAKLGALEGAGRGVEFMPSERARAGLVTNDGVIVVVGEDPAVVFMLSPTLSGGAVSWKCRGFPEKLVPTMCRSKDTT